MNNNNYYEILNVEETATQDDIKKKYRKLAKENHPDIGGDEETFKKISTAYDVLSDEQKDTDTIKKEKVFSDHLTILTIFLIVCLVKGKVMVIEPPIRQILQ
jgi:curved DNA-binding protein CbpA